MKTLSLQAIRLPFLVLWTLLFATLPASNLPELVLDPGGHTGEIVALINLPSRMEFVSCAHDGTIRFWDQSSGQLKRTLRLAHPYRTESKILCADVSPDEKVLAIGGAHLGSKGAILIDLENGKLLRSMSGGLIDWLQRPDITAVKFSPDGQTLVAGNSMGWMSQWTLPTGGNDWLSATSDSSSQTAKLLHQRSYLSPSPIEQITFSNSGEVYYTGSYDGSLAAFPSPFLDRPSLPKSQKTARKWLRNLPGPIVSIHSLGDSALLCGIEKGLVQLVNPVQFNKPERTIGKGTAGIHTIAIDASGEGYFVGGSMPCDAIVSNLNTANPQIYLEPGHHVRPITASTFLNDSTLVTGDHEGHLFLWNTRTGQLKGNCSGSGNVIRMVATTINGQIAAGKTLNSKAIDLCGKTMKKVNIPFYNLDWAFDPRRLSVSDKPETFQSFNSPVTHRGKHKLSISDRRGYHPRAFLFYWDYSVWKNFILFDGEQQAKLPTSWDIFWYPPAYAHEKKSHYLLPGPDALRLLSGNSRGYKFPYPASIALWNATNDFIIAGGTNRVIRIYRKKTRTLLCSLFVNGPDDWICWTPEMKYTGKGEALSRLGWVKQNPSTGMYQFSPLSGDNRALADEKAIQLVFTPS